MYRHLARYLVCPVHEKLVGRETFRFLRELEESQWLAPSDLVDMQRIKLRNLLRHAYRHTVFHRRRMDEAGTDVYGDVDPFLLLARLPLLSKDDIRGSLERMTWIASPGGLFLRHTGGSTGEPLAFYVDRRRQAYDQAARARTHRWFGVDIGERELYLWGSPREAGRVGVARRLRDRLFQHRLLNAFDMSPSRMTEYLRVWDRYRPVCAFGYPSSLALLARHGIETGRRLNPKALQAVFLSGESCRSEERKVIEDYFEAPVADGYGSREAGFLSHQCPSGNRHVTAENVIIEIVNEGKPARVGETGEIVVTHLDAFAMPLIRYRTGDVGRLLPGRCRCGRGLPLMDAVAGRVTDFLRLPDGTMKHGLSVIYPLREIRGIRQFRVTQHEDFGVTVDVVVDDRFARVTREAVAAGVRPVLGNSVPLVVSFVEGIGPSPSGKHRHVLSHVRSSTGSFPGECDASPSDEARPQREAEMVLRSSESA